MGLISILGKAATTLINNIDKVDSASEIVNTIPDKINQVKDIAGKAKDLYSKYDANQTKKVLKSVQDMKDSLGRLDAKFDGREYESNVKVIDDKKMIVSYAIPPQYDSISHIGNNLFAASLNKKWGIINVDNQIIIPFEYEFISASNYNGEDDFIFSAQKDEKWGFINLKNEIVLDFIYMDAWDFIQGMAPVAIFSDADDEFVYGYIDKTGEFIISAKYDAARPFDNPNAATIGMYDENKGKIQYGAINKTGGIIINCRYDSISYEKDYIIGMRDVHSSDFYDYKGVPITPSEEMVQREKEIKEEKDMLNQAVICKRNKNVKNKIIPYFNSELICGYFIKNDEGSFCKIEPMFEEAYNPNKFGYARVKYNGLYGVINLNE